MYFSKPKKRLQPLPKFTPNKKNILTAPHSKRTISLKPIAKNNHQMIKLQCLKEIKELSGRNNKHHKLFLKQPSPPPTRPFDNIILNPTQSKTRKTSTNTILYKKEGLTHHELFQRKESNLNTYFNMRINKLKDITKENKRIYVRLNSQKSLYSSRNLDKSYQDNCNLSRRLSESKMSKASSRCSIALKKSDSRVSMRKKEGNVKKAKEIKVQSHSIKNVGQGEVQRYLQIFCNNSKGNSVSCSKQKIVKQECRTILIQKQNKNTFGKNILQGICEQIKTKTKHKRPVSFARLL